MAIATVIVRTRVQNLGDIMASEETTLRSRLERNAPFVGIALLGILIAAWQVMKRR